MFYDSIESNLLICSVYRNKIHIDWCKAWVQTLTDLQQYVRQHHTTGLVWGKAGSIPAGIPPPPPPSMPIGDVAPPMVNDDRSALFAQINQGEDITKSKYSLILSCFYYLNQLYQDFCKKDFYLQNLHFIYYILYIIFVIYIAI